MGGYAKLLQIDDENDYFFDAVIQDSLSILNAENEEQADSKALFAVAKLKLFQKILIELSILYSFSTEGESFQRSQMFDNLKKLTAEYYTDAFKYLPDSTIETVNF